MAITIQSNPGSYYSVHGDLLFVVVDIVKASDPVTYPDYRYVADVYVDGELAARLKAYPRPDNKMGVFNIGNIVRSYVSAVFDPFAGFFSCQTLDRGDFYKAVQVKFGEEYGLTLYTNLTEDTERVYFNHYNGRLYGQNTSLEAYINKPATVRPLRTPVKSGSNNNFVPFLQPDEATTVTIRSYTDSGTLLATQAIIVGPGSRYDADEAMKIFNCSPGLLNSLYPGLITTGLASYYTATFSGEGDVYRFDIKCEAKYEVFTLHFLNRFGGFESRDFTKVSRKIIDIEKSEYGKLGYTIDTSGNVSYKSSNNVYNETRAVYASQYKEKMTLNTDILSDQEYQWLGDLILSPMVFIEMEGYFIPCAITSNNYEFKKTINDKLTNLTVNIEFGEQFNAQYR